MDQVDERFVPEMLVVRAGTAVSFPNSDQVRHHVYSFSEAKRFELALYRGNVHDPVIFDRVITSYSIHYTKLYEVSNVWSSSSKTTFSTS